MIVFCLLKLDVIDSFDLTQPKFYANVHRCMRGDPIWITACKARQQEKLIASPPGISSGATCLGGSHDCAQEFGNRDSVRAS